MKFQAFINTWQDKWKNALALETALKQCADTVTVVNTNSQIRSEHPSWIHADESEYYSETLNRCTAMFDADVFFQIQADASFDNFDRMFERAEHCFNSRGAGVFEPNADYTPLRYDRLKLTELEPQLYKVPMTDNICWFIHGAVLKQFPPVDASINKLGWGIAGAIAALSALRGKICVRDYSFTVLHPRSRNYDEPDAIRQRNAYLYSLHPTVGARSSALYSERYQLLEIS
jgi:hypothetical protein